MVNRGSTTRRGLPPPSPNSKDIYARDRKLIHRRRLFALTKAKLSGVIELASFMGGFSMIALVELQISETSNKGLLLAFAVITVLLGSLCGFIILFTAWILPHLRADEEVDFVLIETRLIKHYGNHRLFALEKKLRYFVQVSWMSAGIGSVVLFIVDLLIVFWLKFSDYSMTAVYSGHTVLSCALVLMLILGIVFRKAMLKNQAHEGTPEDVKNADCESVSVENQRYLHLIPRRRPSDAVATNPASRDYSASLHHAIKIA